MNMDEFVAFQTEMVRKQAALRADKKPQILCRYELKNKTVCVVQQTLTTCLDCTAEHAEAEKRGAGTL